MGSRLTYFHILWRCLFVFAVFFVCLPHSSGGDAEIENLLRCALLGKFERKCQLEGPELKTHMIDLLKKAPGSFRDVLQGKFVEFKPPLLGKLPHLLVYLLPPEIWAKVEPKVASELIASHRRNEGVARAVMRGYSKATLSNKKDFLKLLDYNDLDPSVVSVLASEIMANWYLDIDTVIFETNPTVYVAIPPADILKMEKSNQVEMLNNIVTWDKYGLSKEKWFNLPSITKRVWAIVSRNYSWVGEPKKTTTPLLAGATPHELLQEGFSFSEYELMQMPLTNRLQIRALFPIVRQDDKLGRIDLGLLKKWFLYLSPDQITGRFRDDLDFMIVVKESHYEWEYPEPRKMYALPSIPTLRQVLEITTMISNERHLLPFNPTQWGDDIAIFGPLAFMIGARRLGKLNPDQKPLNLHTLKDIDSYHFSKKMARHLMFNSKDILKVKGLLRGVPTGKFQKLDHLGLSELDILREIIQVIPADGVARSALVFRKIRENLHSFNNLEVILRNPRPEQFMSLLTFKEIVTLHTALFHHWSRLVSLNLVDKIPSLPDSVLSNLLSVHKALGAEAIPSGIVESKSLAGLTCDRLLAVDSANIPEMIAAMRHARKHSGKTEFSKKLQRCARIALDKYLIDRASSTYASKNTAMGLTASAINPVDIEIFGGFILATFSPEDIERSPHAKLIMKSIGSLSVYELLSAVPCYECLWSMAETAVKINKAEKNITLSHMLDLGSLLRFLPPRLISSVYPAHWRIIAEAAALDGSSQPVCLDEESRELWETVIRSAFGPPEEWKSDTLAAIGGYMPVLLEGTLQSVSLDERASAGDTLGVTSGASYLRGVEFIGYDHPQPFWKVCRNVLKDQDERSLYEMAVRTAARFQLNAAQLFAGKVKNADTLREQQAKFRASLKSKSIVTTSSTSTTEAPRDLNVNVSPTTTQKSAWPWPVWFNTSKFIEERTEEPRTLKPETDKTGPKVDVSDDLDDFINENFDAFATQSSKDVMESSTAVSISATEDSATDTIETDVSFVNKELENSNKLSGSNHPSQVYLDENESLDKMEQPVDPTADLNLNMGDIPNPVVQSEPIKKTNGTVSSMIGLSKIPEVSDFTESDVGSITTDIPDSDMNIVLTPSPNITLSNTSSSSESNIPTSKSPVVDKTDESSNSTTISTLLVENSTDGSISGISRRRRNADLSAFKSEITCDGLLTMGTAAGLALSTSDTDMSYEEFEDCVEFIGKLELSKEVAQAFWGKLKLTSHWKTIGDVGCLAAGLTAADLDNLNLDIYDEHFLDTISAVSMYADKEVVRLMLAKLKKQLDADVSVRNKISLTEEIVLALGQDVCYLPKDTLSHLVNTPNALERALSGMNRNTFFEQHSCERECLKRLLNALVSQNKSREWATEDSRNAGVLVAGFNEEQLNKLTSGKASQPLGEITASAVRCLSQSQLKAIDAKTLVWWSPLAAGALNEDQLQILTEEQKKALKSAIFGRPGISSSEETVLSSSGAIKRTGFVLPTVLAILFICRLY